MPTLTCPSCQQRFDSRRQRAPCPGCGTAVETTWMVARQRKKQGPFTWRQMQTLAARGKLRPDDMVLPEGTERWQAASAVPGLFPEEALVAEPAVKKGRPYVRLIAVAATIVLGGAAGSVALVWMSNSAVGPREEKQVAQAEPAPVAKPPSPAPVEPKQVEPRPKAKPATKPPESADDIVAALLARLNAARVAAGLSPLSRDGELSSDCLAHARYVALNADAGQTLEEVAHAEEEGRPGFSEDGRRAARTAMTAVGHPRVALESWIGRVLPRGQLLNPELASIGIGLLRSKLGWVCVLDAARGRAEQVVLFPGPGQDDVPLTFSGGDEIPNPKGVAGYPITATFSPSQKVTGVEAELKDDAGKSVDAWLSTPEKPAQPQRQRNTVALIAKAALQPLTKYTVRIAANMDGRPWEKTWGFTTEDDADSKGILAGKAVARINAYRTLAGLAEVRLDPALSRGCLAHARYLARNPGHPATLGLGAHGEDLSLPGASKAGDTSGKASNIGIGDHDPLRAIDAWMATLYHRVPILEPNLRTIGYGCARGRNLGWIAVVDMGSGRDKKPRPHGVLYPAPEQVDVPLNFPSREEPNPIPDDPDGRAGYPVTAFFPPDEVPSKVTGRLLEVGGKEVPCWFSSREAPANPKFAKNQGNTVCLIPRDPLRPNTTYHVDLKGSLKSTAWKKAWTFTTGAAEKSSQTDDVLARINDYRRRAGLTPVQLDPELARGCQAHADFLVRNADALRGRKTTVNDEDRELPGYTLEGQQAARHGDVHSDMPVPNMQIDDIAGGVFRRVYLLDPQLRRVGFGCTLDVGRGWRCVLNQIDGRGKTDVILYPGPKQTDVPAALADGSGYPITAIFPPGTPIREPQALLEDAQGKSVEFKLSTPDSPRNAVALLPARPLQPGQAYTVTVSAILGGREWRQSWSFTTRSVAAPAQP